MPRPRSFDEAEVLDAAMDCFWRQGFAGSSVRDLGAAMGLGPASLYNSFGDKHALFTRCLDHYLDGNMRERIARLEVSLAPAKAIAAFLTEIVSRSLADRRGCLLVNSALEVAPHDPAIAQVVAERLAELRDFFRRSVTAGQRDGSIHAGRDAEDLAALLLSTVMGLRVLSRGMPERTILEGAARQVLALLQPGPCA